MLIRTDWSTVRYARTVRGRRVMGGCLPLCANSVAALGAEAEAYRSWCSALRCEPANVAAGSSNYVHWSATYC